METKTRRNRQAQASPSIAKSDQGFVGAWREGTHAWRGKAVLSFFLAFLLCTMQPSGYSLYSAWGGDTSAAGEFRAEAADTPLVASVAEMVAANIATQEAADTEPLVFGNKLFLYPDAGKYAKEYNYATTVEAGGAQVYLRNPDGTYQATTTSTDIVELHSDNKWPYAVGTNALTPVIYPDSDPSKGNFGVATPEYVETTYDGSTIISNPFWMFGYEFNSFAFARPTFLSQAYSFVTQETANAKGTSGLREYEDTVRAINPVIDRGPVGSPIVGTVGGATADSSGNYANLTGFAQWVERTSDYKIRFYTYTGTGSTGSTAGSTAKKKLLNDVTGLSWTSAITMPTNGTVLTQAKNPDLIAKLSTDSVMYVSIDSSGKPTGNGFLGGSGYFWQAANSLGKTEAEYDPMYSNNIYNKGTSKELGYIDVVPYLGVQYLPGAASVGAQMVYASNGSSDYFPLIFTKGDTDIELKAMGSQNPSSYVDGFYGKVETNGGKYQVKNFTDADVTVPVLSEELIKAGYSVKARQKNGKDVWLGNLQNKDGTYEWCAGDVVTDDGKILDSLQLTAQWDVKQTGAVSYDIKLDYGDGKNETGDSSVDMKGVKDGDSLPTDGVLKDYQFVGWAKDEVAAGAASRKSLSAGDYFTEVQSDVGAGTTYHAVYEPLVSITFKAGHDDGFVSVAGPIEIGAVTGKTSDGTDLDSLPAQSTASPTDTNGTVSFSNWTGGTIASGGNSNATLTVTKDMLNANSSSKNFHDTEFTANFTSLYTVEFEIQSGTGTLGTATTPISKVASGYTITDDNVPDATPDTSAGYSTPVKWYKSENGGEEEEIPGTPSTPKGQTITANTKFIAKPTAQTPTASFKLVSSATDDGVTLVNGGDQTVAYGGTVSTWPTINVPSTMNVKYDGTIASWTPDKTTALTGDTTFTATPTVRTYTVKVALVGAQFSDNTTTHQYANVPYGTDASTIDSLVSDFNAMKVQAGYDSSNPTTSGTWANSNTGGATDNPTASGTLVKPTVINDEIVYTYTLKASKPTATFKLASGYTDVKFSGKSSSTDTVTEDVNYNTAPTSVPTLDSSYNSTKYTGNITWVEEGKTGAVDPASVKLKSDVTYVGTPELADITVTFKVVGGTWGDGSPANKTTTAKYGDTKLTNIPTNMKADSGYVQGSGTWEPDPTGIDVEHPFDGTKTEFTYTFKPSVTDTYIINDGLWASGTTSTTSSGVAGSDATVPDITAVTANAGFTTSGSWNETPSSKIVGGKTYTYSLKAARTVTFKVEGGTWANGTTADIQVTVPDGEALKAAQIPTGMKVASGYDDKNQSWYASDGITTTTTTAMTNASNTVGAAGATYVYKFAKGKTSYTVNVYKQKVDAANNTVSFVAPSGYDVTTITVDGQTTGGEAKVSDAMTAAGLTATPPTGFKVSTSNASSSENIMLSGTASENVFNFYYDRNTYSVTYAQSYQSSDSDIPTDATVPSDTTAYYYEATVTVKDKPTTSVPGSNYYTCNGWYLNATSGTARAAGSTFTITQDSTLNATWARTRVAVSFELKTAVANGTIDHANYTSSYKKNGTNKRVLLEVPIGETVSFPKVIEGTSGYFRHWNTDDSDASKGIVTNTADFVVTGPITYYAWFDEYVVVSYMHDTPAAGESESVGKFEEVSQTNVKAKDGTIDASKIPSDADTNHKPGYTFTGWTGGGITTPTSTSDLATAIGGKTPSALGYSSFEFTANYEGIPHGVYIDLTNGGTITDSSVALATGYTALSSDSSNPTSKKTGESATLPTTAQLTRTGYTLTGFTVTATDDTASEKTYTETYAPGSNLKIGANSNGTNVKVTVTPVWEPKTNSITYQYTKNRGSGTLPTVPAKVDSQAYATEYELAGHGTTPDGYTWGGWMAKTAGGQNVDITGNETDGYKIASMPNDDVIITGTYNIKTYKVVYQFAEDVSDAGSLNPASAVADYGTDLATLRNAVSLTGYNTTKWAGTIASWNKNDASYTTDPMGGSATLSDDTTVADSNTESTTGRVVTFVATPQPKLYTIRLVVTNGTYDNAETGATGAAISTTVPYGAKANEYVTSDVVDKIKGNDNTSPKGWTNAEDDGNPTLDEAIVQGNRTFTYEYAPTRTVKFVVANGTWNTDATTEISIPVADGATLSSDDVRKVLNGTTVLATAGEGYEGGSWGAGGAPDDYTPITADTTYTYTYTPMAVTYTIKKWYEPLTGAAYDQVDGENKSGNSTFGVTLNASSLTAAENKADRTGFANTHVDPTPLTSTTAVTMQADSTKNVFDFYYNRERLSVSYQWGGVAPTGVTLPDGETDLKYGADYEVPNKAYDTVNGNTFSGWHLGSASGDTIEGGHKFENVTSDIVLVGTWEVASYDVTYRVSNEVDTTTWDGTAGTATVADGVFTVQLGDDTPAASVSDKVKYDKKATAAKAIVSSAENGVTVGEKKHTYQDQYEFDYWSYHTGASPTEVTIPNGGDPSTVTIDGEDYVFTAHFKLKTLTVNYTEGSHGQTLGQKDNQTVFTLKYGENTPVPTAENINTNGGADGKVKVLVSDQYGYALSTNEWPWTPAKADKAYVNQTYAADFVERTYKVSFLNIDGSSMKNTTDSIDLTGPNTGLAWTDSIFKEGSVFDATTAAMALSPTKGGKTFKGWRASNSDGTILQSGTLNNGDLTAGITVSAVFGATTDATLETDTLYVWAEWENNPATLTYHTDYDADETVVKTGYKVDDEPQLSSAAALQSEQAAFARTGYTFTGWNTEAAASAETGTAYAAGDKLKLTTDTTDSGTNNVYARWTANSYTVRWLNGDGDVISESDEPITQAIKFDDASYKLNKMSDKATAPTDDPTAVFVGWTVDADGKSVDDEGDLTADQLVASESKGNVITLSPRWAGKVKLTFNDGVATAVIDVPETMQESLNGDTATFTLKTGTENMLPSRDGYEFKGWDINGNTYLPTAKDDATVQLSSDAVAIAQWDPGLSKYTVERYFETGLGTGEWPEKADQSVELWGATDSTGTLEGLAEDGTTPKKVEAAVAGYDLTSPASLASTTITADEKAVIKLYYKVKSFEVSYEYQGVDTADKAAVAAVTPESATLTSGQSYTFTDPDLDALAALGYEEAGSSQDGKWQYAMKDGAAATGEATGTITPTGDVKVVFQVQKKSFDVTYKIDENGRWTDKAADAPDAREPKTETDVKWGSSPKMKTDGTEEVTPVGVTDDYALAGWAIEKDGEYDDSALVDPLTYEVKGNVTFVAVFKHVHVVTYLPGAHAVSNWDASSNKTSYTDLGADSTPVGQYSAADAALVLADDEWESAGVPKAADGYEFLGWAVKKNGVEQTYDDSIIIEGTTYYYTATLPLETTGNDDDYVFTAIWGPTEQSVAFKVGAHPAAGDADAAVSGKTGETKSAPSALDGAAYYTFTGWKLTSGSSSVAPATLAADEDFAIPAVNGVEYTAQYKADEVELRYESEDENMGTVSKKDDTVQELADPDAGYSVTAVSKAGYEFTGWTAKDKDGNDLDISDWGADDKELVILPVADGNGNDVYQAATFTAHFKKLTAKVTYVLDDGSASFGALDVQYADSASYESVEYGKTPDMGSTDADNVYVIPKPADGYTIDEWTYEMKESLEGGETNVVNGTGVIDPNSITIKGDTVFTLKLKPGTVQLTYDGNGAAGGSVDAATGTNGESVKVAANGFSRPGYTFKGWSTDANRTADDWNAEVATDYAPNDDFTLAATGNVLYAIWASQGVKVNYHSNYKDTTIEAVTTPATVDYGVDAAVADPADVNIPTTGYKRGAVDVPAGAVEFLGWSTDPNATSPEFKVGEDIPGAMLKLGTEEALDLHAVWADKAFKVTFNGNGSTSGSMGDITPVYYGDTVTIPQNAFERTGHRFLQWNINPSSPVEHAGDTTGAATTYDFLLTQDATFTPDWQRDPSTVANIKVEYYDSDGKKLGEVADLATTDQPMGTYVLPVHEHYKFKGWYADAEHTTLISANESYTGSIADVLGTYYDASVSATYQGKAYWSSGDFASGYEDGKNVVIPLYLDYELSDYVVKYDPNLPDGYTQAPASAVAAMADQEFTVGEGQSIRANAFEKAFPGYRFLGWVNSVEKPTSAIMTQDDFGDLSNTVATDYNTNSGELVSGDQTETTLWAMWENTPNTVTFLNHFDGDGLTNIESEWGVKTIGIGWDDAIEATTDIGDPRNYGDQYADYGFEGWYAMPVSALKAATSAHIPVTLGETKFGAVVTDLQTAGNTDIYDSETGAYNIVLYAKYAKDAIKIVYHEGVADDATQLPATRTLKVDDSPSAVRLTTNALGKQGYEPAGWTTSPTVWKTTDENFQRDPETTDRVNAVGTEYTPVANQREDVNLYPAFTPRLYTVNYEYKTVGDSYDYASGLTRAKTPGGADIETYANATGNVEWDTSGFGTYGIANASDPTLAGYSFAGWYIDEEHQDFPVRPNTELGDISYDTPGADDAQLTYTLYAAWTPDEFTVSYDLQGGTYDDEDSIDPVEHLTWNDEQTLIPDPANLGRAGSSSGYWYVTDGENIARVGANAVYTMSYADLYAAWAALPGNQSKDVPSEITLYAGYEEGSVDLVFKVDEAQHSYLASAGGADLAGKPTQLTVTIGAEGGLIEAAVDGDGNEVASAIGKNIASFTVVAAADEGFAAADPAWEAENDANGATVAGNQLTVAKAPGADAYEADTYTFYIESAPTTYTVEYYYQALDGESWDHNPADNGTGTGEVGDIVSTAVHPELIEAGLPAMGFEFSPADSKTSIELSLTEADNVLRLYYVRSLHDVKFLDFKWQGADEPTAVPMPPDDRLNQMYGSAQALPDAEEVSGFYFAGWYVSDEDGNIVDEDNPLSAQFDMPDEDVYLVGVYKARIYDVDFDGVKDAITGETVDDATFTKLITYFPVKVIEGQTLATTDPSFKVSVVDDALNDDPDDGAQVEVEYNSTKYPTLMWVYQDENGNDQFTTDPANVVITHKTTFTATVSDTKSISYLHGKHGLFDTSDAAGTSFKVSGTYNMAPDYLYDGALDDRATNVGNAGKPIGEVGYRFTGWEWRYIDNGVIVTGTSVGEDDPVNDGVKDLVNLDASITLTAQWEETEAYVKFDLNDGDGIGKSAAWTDDGLEAGYDTQTAYKTDALVGLPGTADAERLGFKLAGWTYTDADDKDHHFEQGGNFTMPAVAEGSVITLKAVWDENPVTITYLSENTAKGTVSNDSDFGGVWSLDAQGSTATAEPLSGYLFEGWRLGSATGEIVERGFTIIPQPNADGMFEDATYVATFVGDECQVTFVSEDLVKGRLVNAEGADLPALGYVIPKTYKTKVTSDEMAGIVPVANAGYVVPEADGWSYEMTNKLTGEVTSDTVSDPTSVEILGDTVFKALFEKSDVDYTVNYDATGVDYDVDGIEIATPEPSDSQNTSATFKWDEGVLLKGAPSEGPVKPGFTFLGWFTESGSEIESTDTDLTYGEVAIDPNVESITLKAHWQMKDGYTLKFAPQGGSDAYPVDAASQPDDNQLSGLAWSTEVNGSDARFQMGDTARTGYTFLGWYDEPEQTAGNLVLGKLGEDPVNAYSTLAKKVDKESVTVYAHWSENKYTVDYINDDKVYETKEVPYTNSVRNSPIADQDTRVWNGWYYVNGSEQQVFVDAEHDATVESMLADGAKFDTNGHLQLFAAWTPRYTVTTTYVPYVLVSEGTTSTYQKVEDAEWLKTFASYFKKDGGFVLEGGVAQAILPTGNNAVPGFTYDPTAAAVAAPPWTEADLTVTNVHANVEFTIPVVARHTYGIQYDLNDNGDYPGGTIPSDNRGDTAYDQTRPVYSFASDKNVPYEVVDGEAVMLTPTRPGFNFVNWVNHPDASDGAPGLVDANLDTQYGDLTVEKDDATWYDPDNKQLYDSPTDYITLFVNWKEKTHRVYYEVSDEWAGVGQIKLLNESADKWDAEQREEDITAAWGKHYDEGNTDAYGAEAQAVKRGYKFVEWRYISDFTLNERTPNDTSGGDSNGSSAMRASNVVSAVMTVMSAAAVEGAGIALTAQDDTEDKSKHYSDSAKILPGTIASGQDSTEKSRLAGLFAGTDVVEGDGASTLNPTDGDSAPVTYIAMFAQEEDSKPITFDPNGADSYTGPTELPGQPVGTYVGEKEPWGEHDGELPAASTLSREGYTFGGWEDLNTHTIYDPAKVESGQIPVPADGIAFRAVWIKDAAPEKTSGTISVDEVTLPNGTKVSSSSIEKKLGSYLTEDEIESFVNRAGYTPSKWTVTEYNDDGTVKSTSTLTTDELRTYFKNNAITGDVSISVPSDATWAQYAQKTDGTPSNTPTVKPSTTRPASSPKTGDMPYLAIAGACAVIAGGALLVLLAIRKRRQDD